MKDQNPWIKLALEIGPVAIYFFAYQYYDERILPLFGQEFTGVVAATIVFVPVMLASLVISWVLTRHLPRMAVFTAIIVVVFGVLTVWFNDDTFTKIRPAIIYGLFAFILGFGLFVQKRSYLEYLMGENMPLTHQGWYLFTRNFVVFFVLMVVINEFTWRVLGEEAWVFLDSFGQLILTFVFIATQYPIFSKHSTQQ